MILSPFLGLLVTALAPLRVAAQHFPVTGVKVDAGADVPLRLNINDLYSQGGPQWDLYLRALKSLQDKDASDPLSYFQVSGIHGLPYIEWQNGGPYRATGWAGYCPHGESIFLSWHRPFVLLFEQLLVAEAKAIAATYPDRYRDQYMNAANKLRSPFWDWSQNSDVPPCTVPAWMTVNVPDGQNLKQITIHNPLQTYTYPQKAIDGAFGRFNRYSTTSRCPPPDRYPDTANARLGRLGLRQSTYDAFTYSSSFSDFANTREDGGIGLEQIHNSIHWDAGCAGQFLDSNTAAFDALFMLHHTHVDRLWAYASYINPDFSDFNYQYYGLSRFSTPEGTTITPDSPLPPFYDGRNSYWTPSKVASIQGMGYTYEGLEYWRKSPEQLRDDATSIINSLYAPSDNGPWGKRSTTHEENTRYFARIELDRARVERPCTVKIFVDGKQAGKVVVMQQPESGILNGRVAVDHEVHGVFATTPSSNGTVSSIEHLVEMEISKPDGTIIPLSTVPSLKLTLEEVTVTPRKSHTELPKPGMRTKLSAGVRDRHEKEASHKN
ncbi:hypothetical protein E4U43_004173 [Claviceps pusilla]|uniref:tyrosinase n=1 Tax=Claviceps pusilla TaxID=123648 RepID=A0A9P7NHH3_9HYPO|nr:hypothetical protein E4U43_004173 [Claviceps pusilla]